MMGGEIDEIDLEGVRTVRATTRGNVRIGVLT